ncbi:hypothetical protein FE257_004525 [Aspergillus nanangensis]|uniref:Uncharacterized protein n=1 Tax=Aspergillus nanangensis TaxID=2582783 RepID=A0AAD4CZY4_ASPNN|nr:hypothetical protein FE257_004525 [Aspergillus nanangensis]
MHTSSILSLSLLMMITPLIAAECLVTVGPDDDNMLYCLASPEINSCVAFGSSFDPSPDAEIYHNDRATIYTTIPEKKLTETCTKRGGTLLTESEAKEQNTNVQVRRPNKHVHPPISSKQDLQQHALVCNPHLILIAPLVAAECIIAIGPDNDNLIYCAAPADTRDCSLFGRNFDSTPQGGEEKPNGFVVYSSKSEEELEKTCADRGGELLEAADGLGRLEGLFWAPWNALRIPFGVFVWAPS